MVTIIMTRLHQINIHFSEQILLKTSNTILLYGNTNTICIKILIWTQEQATHSIIPIDVYDERKNNNLKRFKLNWFLVNTIFSVQPPLHLSCLFLLFLLWFYFFSSLSIINLFIASNKCFKFGICISDFVLSVRFSFVNVTIPQNMNNKN